MATKATEKTTTARGKQLQATVSTEVHDAYVEHHWEARKDTVDLVRDALHEYGINHGFLVTNEEGVVVPKEKDNAKA